MSNILCAISDDINSGSSRISAVVFSMEGKNHFIAPEYGCIAPLRMLLLKQSDPATWNRLQMLMDHDAERKTETDYQKMFQVLTVDFKSLSQTWKS